MKITEKITAPLIAVMMILNTLSFTVQANDGYDFESDILNKTVFISQDFEAENAKAPLNLDASPYGPTGDITNSPDGNGKAIRYDSNHKNPFTINPVTKDARTAVMDFDIYIPEGENPKNDFLRVVYMGSYNAIARIKSDGIMEITGKPDETYQLTADTWHTLRFIVDYNGARGILFASEKGDTLKKVGEISLTKGTASGIGRFQQATFNSGKVYCDNYSFITYADMFDAINNCRTASDVKNALAFYEEIDIFTPSDDEEKAESTTTVYEALTGRNFKSNEEVKSAYLDAVASAYTGIKSDESATGFEGNTAQVTFANTSDEECVFTVYHLAYERFPGYHILREKSEQSVTLPAYSGENTAYETVSYEFKNLSGSENLTVKTIIAKSETPVKCITYGEDIIPECDGESDEFSISSAIDNESGIFTVHVSGARKGETVMVSALDGEYTGCITADDKGCASFAFMHPDCLNSEKAYKIKVYTSSGNIEETSVTYPLDKVRPTLESVILSGESVIGGTLKSDAEGYFQPGGLEEDESKRVYRWYVSDSPESTPALIDGENLSEFKIDSDSYGEKFITASVTVMAKGGEYSKEYFSQPSAVLLAPKAENVKISGAPVVGNILRASYEYYHVTNAECGTVIKWITLNDDGKEDEILKENSLEYIPLENDTGKTLAFSVTPMTDTDPKKGATVVVIAGKVAEKTDKTEPPVATNVKIEDSFESNTLSVSYSYSQKAGTPAAQPDIMWYISDSPDGVFELITESATLEYKDEYSGKFIKAELSPVSAEGIRGLKSESEPFKIHSVPQVSNLTISGRKANDQKVRATYDFTEELKDYDVSEISWYLDSELKGTGKEFTTPQTSGGKELKLTVKAISSVFPHLGETVTVTEILDSADYAVTQKSKYQTQTIIAPASKYGSGNMDTYTDSNPNTDYGENTYLSINASNSSPWITGFDAGGIVTVDMRVYLTPVKDRNEKSGEMIRFRHSDTSWGPYFATFNSGKIKGSETDILPENEWINLRLVADPDDKTVSIYYGSDINHLEKATLLETASVYAPTSSTSATYLQLAAASGSKVSDIWNIGSLVISGMPPMYETAKTADTTSELREIMKEYEKYSLFEFPDNYQSIDDEEFVLRKILANKDSFESTKDLEACLKSLCDLHQNGASVDSCKLLNGSDDISGDVITGIPGIYSQTTLRSTGKTGKILYVLTAVYEKNANGNKTLRALDIQESKVPAEGTVTTESRNISLDSSVEYTVNIMVWDKESAPDTMLSVKSFNAYLPEEYTNENKTPSETIEIHSCTFDPVTGQVKTEANAKGGDGQYVSVEAISPSGKRIYADEVYTSGKNGAFKSEFTLSSPAENGIYTIEFTLNKSGKSQTTQFEITDAAKTEPTVRRLKISGDTYYGNSLKADYEYFQLGGSKESATQFKWLISSDPESGFVPVKDTSNAKKVSIESDYTGKYIKVIVTPVSEEGTQGQSFESEPVRILATPFVTNVKITGDIIAGKTVSVTYKFTEPIFGHPEYGTQYEWYIGSELKGTQQSFKIPSSAEGKYIKCIVTPGIEAYPYYGESVESSSARIGSAESKKGSGGGGGGAPSSVILPQAIAPGTVPQISQTPDSGAFTIFEDTINHWANASIGRLFEKRIINGVDSTHFNPDGSITRAEFAALINRITGHSQTADISFSDVDTGAWYFEDVRKIVSSEIMQGSGENSFRPGDYITREEMALVARRVYTYKYGTVPSMNNSYGFNDFESISPWAYDAVMYCRNAGILTGDPSGNYNPKNNVTRAEAAVVIERLINLK